MSPCKKESVQFTTLQAPVSAVPAQSVTFHQVYTELLYLPHSIVKYHPRASHILQSKVPAFKLNPPELAQTKLVIRESSVETTLHQLKFTAPPDIPFPDQVTDVLVNTNFPQDQSMTALDAVCHSIYRSDRCAFCMYVSVLEGSVYTVLIHPKTPALLYCI